MEHVFTADNFDAEVLKSDTPVLVDFWAPWCGPCRFMAPIVDELAQEWEGRVKVGKLNVDEHGHVSMEYRILSIPTFILFKGGKVVHTIVGGREKAELKEEVEKHLQ